MPTLLSDLQTWYTAQCDGDWEHGAGIRICTLDNPGWSVQINLEETLLENKTFAEVERRENQQSWLHCRIEHKDFVGLGDPSRLEEILTIFLDWARSERDWLAIPDLSDEEVRRRREEELWSVLGEEVGPAQCRASGCERHRIRFSAFCCAHHFERMTGRLRPDDD